MIVVKTKNSKSKIGNYLIKVSEHLYCGSYNFQKVNKIKGLLKNKDIIIINKTKRNNIEIKEHK